MEKFAINSVISATHTAEMDEEDRDDIIKKINKAGNDENSKDDNNDSGGSGDDFNNDGGDVNNGDGGSEPMDMEGHEEGLQELSIYENKEENIFLDNPKKNNMFQEGSNDILDEMKPCYKGYKQYGMKEKDGREVPNCVPIKENIEETNNYMFLQNLKTINHASGELLKMDFEKIDKVLSNGHGWALDHIATSADDIEEVYHFLEANAGEYDGSTEGGYEDEYGTVENINLNEAEYKGKTVKLGKPMKGDVKKFKVYVKNDKGNVIKVNFGDPNMEIKRDDPERRKSFRARHKCSQAKDRTTPKYWSCRMWSSTPVSKMVAEDLNNSNKNSIFDKNYLTMKLHETFNDNAEPMVQPAPVKEPTTKPNEVQPVQPSRKNKPFLPRPEVTPDPKAEK